MKKLNSVLTLALLLSFVISCNPEPLAETLEKTPESLVENMSAEYVNFERTPIIEETLTAKIEKDALLWSKNSKSGAGFYIDKDRVVKITDSLGNHTYGMQLLSTKPSIDVMYNLVITERATGPEIAPTIIKYEFEEGNRRTYAAENNKRFNGKISVFSLEQFASAHSISGRTGNLEPCDEGTSGGGSGGGNGGGNGGSGGWGWNNNPDATGSLSVNIPPLNPGSTSGGTVEVGQGSFGEFGADTMKSIRNGKFNGEPCPEGELLIPVVGDSNDGIWHTACRSFEYTALGGTDTKVAAVSGISHPLARGGRCPGIGYVLPQAPYYFSLPIGTPRDRGSSTRALEKAFARLDTYFDGIACKPNAQVSAGELAMKLEKYIKEEFKKIGGQASKYPPLGYNGEIQEYETNIGMTTPDCN